MNTGFESQLERQPLRRIPSHWRARILAVAQPAPSGWRQWFQPWPEAWRVLGAAWLVILALHFTTPNDAPLAGNWYPVTAESTVLLQEQTMIMAQMLNPAEADEPPAALPAEPKPRSEIARRERIG